jgi:hypothetical protein
MTQRLQRHPFLAIFDGPDTNSTTDTRSTSTVPLQALFFLNNPFFQNQAKRFAERIIAAANEPGARIQLAFEIAVGRLPTEAELDTLLNYVNQLTAEIRTLSEPGEDVELEAWTSVTRTILTANEFVYID